MQQRVATELSIYSGSITMSCGIPEGGEPKMIDEPVFRPLALEWKDLTLGRK